MAFEKTLIGFQLGLLIVLTIYVLGAITNRRVTWLRTWMILLAVPFVAFSSLPFKYEAHAGYIAVDIWQIVKVIGTSLLLVVVIASIANSLLEITKRLTHTEPSAHLRSKMRQIFFAVGIITPICIIGLTSISIIEMYYTTIGNLLRVAVGLWVALWLFVIDKRALQAHAE